ncbi:MAG TPA: DPP IV N-terminal domain-containing protein, partial [Thermotogota bacterium]|nr:DPP IV N-terminal domain-containing protein [Thermotogota bacterium]
MIGMEKRIVLIALVATLCICTLSFALSQPLLVVKDSLTKAGNTYLALVLPGKSEEVRLTEDMFRISFPRVCERTGMIGFTHHTASMKAEIYLIPPGQTKPEKVKDGAILEGFSPDGKYLLYTNASAAPSLWAFDIDTGQETRLTSGLAVSSAAWSPDGQWIAFAVLTSTGRNDLYLMKWSDRSIERLTQTAQIDEYYPVFTSDS